MVRRLFSKFLIHSVIVKTYEGVNEWSERTYTAGREVRCLISDKTSLVTMPGGNQTSSGTSLAIDTDEYYDWFTPDSTVVVRGNELSVLTRDLFEGGDILPTSMIVYLQ